MAIEQIRNGERGLSVRNKLNALISSFNTAGFGVGPANNIFGTTSGDVNADNLNVSPASNKAAAEGVRDTYFTANPSNLAEYDASAGLHIFLSYNDNGDTVLEAQSRTGNAWVRSVAIFAIQGAPGGEMALAGVPSGRVLFNNNGVLAAAPARVMDDDTLFVEGITRIEAGTLAMGPFIQISERGGFVGLTNALGDEFTLVDYRTPRDAPSTTPRILEYTEAENNFVIQAVQTESLSSPLTFNYTPTLLARTNALISEVGTDVTNLRFRIANAADVTQVLKYWPSEAAWLDDRGEDFAAGVMTLDFEDTELPLNSTTTLQIDIRYDSGTLLGDTNGVPVLTAVLQRGQFAPLGLQRDDVDGISASVNAGVLSIVLSRGEDIDDLTTTVAIPTTGTAPPAGSTDASITRFEIAGQATSVLAGTTLTGTKSFNYNVNHPEDVNGNLTLRQGTSELRTDIDPNNNSITQLINDVTLGNNQTAIFELRGETNEGILLTSFFRVRAHLPPEQLFFGQSTSDNPDSIDTATLSHTEAGVDGAMVTTGDTVQGNYFILLVPADHDVVSIVDGLGQNVTSIFTRTEDVRTLSSVSYHSYVFGPVNAGASESYTLRF